MSDRFDVLVAGGGPTGLMLASELLRHGATVCVVDEAPERRRISKATIVMPRTLELFHAIGIADRLIGAGVRLDGLAMFSGKKMIFELTADDIDSPYPFLVSIEQFRTEEVLEEHLNHLGGTLMRSTTLTGFTDGADGVEATLRRADGSDSRVAARYLVGCDGAHSLVRKSLGLPFEGETETVDHFAVAYLPIDWDMPRDRILEIHSQKGNLLANALPDNQWSMFMELDPAEWAEAPHDSPTTEELQRLIDERSPVPAKIGEPLWTTYFRISHRQVPSYRHGNVFVAGDAAHIHSPAGGQGMNTGLQDAINLGWKLALVCRGGASDSLLSSYDLERRPVGKEVLALTTELQTDLELRNRALIALRDNVLHLLDHVGPARKLLARVLGELSYNYRKSPVCSETGAGRSYMKHQARHPSLADCCEFAAGPRAGDRAPASGANGTTAPAILDLLRSGKSVLLLFEGTHIRRDPGEAWPAIRDVATDIRSRLDGTVHPVVVTPQSGSPGYLDWNGAVIHDDGGVLHHGYGARGQCQYLIRPDGYIGYRSEPIDKAGLHAYFNAIGILPVSDTVAGDAATAGSGAAASAVSGAIDAPGNDAAGAPTS